MSGLKNKHILLKEIKLEDEEWLFQLNSNPVVMKFFPSVLNRLQNNELLKAIMDHHAKHGFGVYKIASGKGKPMGMLGLNRVGFKSFFTPSVEILWRLFPEYWNKGIATYAALKCMEIAEFTLKLNEVVAFTSIHNLPSRKVMEKIGMEKLAVFNHPKIIPGHWLSSHILYKKVFLETLKT